MIRHSSRSISRCASFLACAGVLLVLVGCAGRQLSTSVQDQSLITPPPPPVVEAPPPEPPKIEEAKVEPEPIAPPPPVEAPPAEPPKMEEPAPPPAPMEEAKAPEPEPAPPPAPVEEPVPPPPAPIEEAKVPEPEPAPPPVEEAPPPPVEEAKPAPPPVEEAPPPPPPPVVEPPPPAEPLTLGDVFFDYDRALIRSDAMSVLEENARRLKANNEWSLEIEGHCDERGTLEYNLVLGEKRARAVKQYLQDLGVRSGQIGITSYGKEKPFCTDHSVDCWQQNRRAHFVVK